MLPLLSNGALSRDVTHNAMLRLVDFLLHPTVQQMNISSPGVATSYNDGTTFVVKATGAGEWAGHDDDLAVSLNSKWVFFEPFEGLMIYDQNTNGYFTWQGSSGWVAGPS